MLHFEFIVRFPFDVKNPIGYTMAVILEYLLAFNVDLFAMCIMVIAIGSSVTLISVTQDLNVSLKNLDKSAMMKDSPLEIVQQFNEFIRFHSNAKQLSD